MTLESQSLAAMLSSQAFSCLLPASLPRCCHAVPVALSCFGILAIRSTPTAFRIYRRKPLGGDHRWLPLPSCLLLGLLAGNAHAALPPTLILMGGSYRTCSSLDTDDCLPDQREFKGAREAPLYRVDRLRFPEVLDAAYWQRRPGSPTLQTVESLLNRAEACAGGSLISASALVACLESADASGWRQLLTQEQDLIVSAFELPQLLQGQRKLEGVRLDGANRLYDAAMFRQLVAEAAKRSPGRKPRVAFTTSASANGFDAVDFYRGLLTQAGAEPVWWPVDAALAKVRFEAPGDCTALPRLRLEKFSILGRERVFPDLAAEQQQACLDQNRLDAVPTQVQALFLDGGDQWLHQQTFFTPDGRPNAWLTAVRRAFLRGKLVVSGTSAGAAVQSGVAAMITNGTSTHALVRGAKAYEGSMPEGCQQASRCPPGYQEDDLTWWSKGGLNLLGPYLVDTHVAERQRELRLVTLMSAVAARNEHAIEAGIGINETSALTLKMVHGALEIEASGQSGAWWIEPPHLSTTANAWSVRAHFLAPGARLRWQHAKMQLVGVSTGSADTPPTRQTPALLDHADRDLAGGDALQPETLRTAVWRMAREGYRTASLQALDFQLKVTTTPETQYWHGPQGQQGVTQLQLTLTRP